MKQKKVKKRNNFLKKIIFSLIGMPILLLSIDSDLDLMNKYDNEKTKSLSPLFTTRAGYAYSDWKMPSMNSFTQETQGLNLVWIDLIYKGNMDTVDGNRNYLHYERSFNKNLDEEIIRQEDAIKNKDMYELLLAKLSFNNIFLEASMERYLTRIIAKDNSLFIDNKENDHYLYKGDSLGFETKFNEIKLGLSSSPLNNKKYVNYFLFFGDYQKPYTIRKNKKEISEFSKYLFYSKIQTIGIGASGIAMSDNGFYIDSELKMGGGKIELTNNHDLEDFDINSLTFFQAKIKLGYAFPLIKSIKNLKMHIQALYDIRYFDESQEGTTYVGESTTNKEEIKKAFVSLQYSF